MQLPVCGLDAQYINKGISAISVNLRQKWFRLPKVYLFFWDKDKSWLISYKHYIIAVTQKKQEKKTKINLK